MKKVSHLLLLCFLQAIFNEQVHAQTYNVIAEMNIHHAGITALTKDLQNRFLIAGDQKGFLYFHDLRDGKLIHEAKAHEAGVSHLQFNSNGRLLISATTDGEIKIFDLTTNKIIQGIYSPDYEGINFVLFSIADGFVYFNGNNKLFKTRSDLTQRVDLIYTESDTIKDAVITSDRSALIYACGGKLKVINTRTDGIIQEFNTGISKIDKISLVKDSLLATWSMDGTIYFWQYGLGQVNPTPVFFLKGGNPASMNFSDDGTLMCSGNIGNWARIWKPMDRKIIQELFAHTNKVTSATFGINNNCLFTGSLDGKIIQWKNDTVIVSDSTNIKLNVTSEIVDIKTEQQSIITTTNVIMGEKNVPAIIEGRKVISTSRIETASGEIKIYVFDNSYNDGDTMSLFFNGKWILDHYGVTTVKKEINLVLTPNTNNYLVLFANNLGKKPPNTAAIEFRDGKSKKIFRLSSDLNNCSAINFFYRK